MSIPHVSFAPLSRCGEMVGRAAAGLIIVASAGLAIVAVMADLL